MTDESNQIFNQISQNFQLLQNIVDNKKQNDLFYFKGKLIVNKNNSFQLLDRVITLSKQYMYIYYAQPEKNQQLRSLNAQVQSIPFNLIQSPQLKIQLKNYTSFNIISQNDSRFNLYLKSIYPQFQTLNQQYVLVFLKNHNQYQMINILLPNYIKAQQFCYAFTLTECLRIYDIQLEKRQIQINFRLIKSLANVRFGLIQIDPHQFGYGWKYDYNSEEQKKEISFFIEYSKTFFSNLPIETLQKSTLKLKFKIIDAQSINYAKIFLTTFGSSIRKLFLSKCQLNDLNLAELFSNPVKNPQFLKFNNLRCLNLCQNKLTDGFFKIFKLFLSKQSLSQLYLLNLSKNYIMLSQPAQKNFLDCLQKTNYKLKINLSQNRIKSLNFFIKYFVQTDIRSILPIQYVNLKKNQIHKVQKNKFIDGYLKKLIKLQQIMKQIQFIADLGSISTPLSQNQMFYLDLLEHYYRQKQQISQEQNFTFTNKINKIIQRFFTYQITKQKILGNIDSRVSIAPPLSPNTSVILSLNNNKDQIIGQFLQKLMKYYLYNDYKKIQQIKNQLIQKYGISEELLKNSLTNQMLQKNKQQKIIIRDMEQVVNLTGNDTIKINQLLDKIVRIIKRSAIQGKASEFITYLKYKRDIIINNWLQNKKKLQQVSPYVQYLRKITQNTQFIQQSSQINYHEILQSNEENFIQKFIQNKQSQNFNEQFYDRYKFILFKKKLTLKQLIPLIQTILHQPKIILIKIIKNYQNFIRSQKTTPIIITKQKIKNVQFEYKLKKVDYLSKYQLNRYVFNNNIDLSMNLSQYRGIMSCLNFDQQKYSQILGFIQVVKNFMTFLYYTPDNISQQTVTYLNYICNYLDSLNIQYQQDLQYKYFLIEQMYLHIMTFKSQINLNKGILLKIFQYLTQRLNCTTLIEKFIIAYLLKNQSQQINHNKLIVSDLSVQRQYSNQVKLSWLIPNIFLVQSFKNQGNIKIYLKIQQNQQLLQINLNPTLTFNEIFIYLQKQTKHNKLDKYQIYEQQIKYYWFYSNENINKKLTYFKPIQSYKYLGEFIAETYGDKQDDKIIINFKRLVSIERQHDCNLIQNQYKLQQLINLFNKIFQNLFICIQLLNKASIFDYIKKQKKLSNQQTLIQLISQLIYIKYQILIVTELSIYKRPQYRQQYSNQQQFYQFYLSQEQKLFKQIFQKINKHSQYLINFKEINIQDKYSLMQKVRTFQQNDTEVNLPLNLKIIRFIKLIGDIGYTKTIIDNDKIICLNGRFLVIGKLKYHKNQTNQIIKVYSEIQFFTYLNRIVDLRLQFIDQTNTDTAILIQNIYSQQNNIKLRQFKLTSSNQTNIYFIQLINAISHSLINFNNQSFNQIQSNNNNNNNIGLFNLNFNKQKLNNQNQNINNKKKKQLFVQSYFTINQKLIHYSLIRNKQNRKIERQKTNNKGTQLQVIKQDRYKIQFNPEPEPEVQQVFSRKSSKRSLVRNKSSKRQFNKPPSPRSSLINSKSSQIVQMQIQKQNNNLKLSQVKSQYNIEVIQIKNTQNIVNNQSELLKQSKNSQNSQIFNQIIKQKIKDQIVEKIDTALNVVQFQQVLTNQRKSKRQLPKRRSSRQKS